MKQQIEVERHIVQIRSPIYNLINIPIRYKFRKNKFSKSFLNNMSVSQLQLIVNDMYSQIESEFFSLFKTYIKFYLWPLLRFERRISAITHTSWRVIYGTGLSPRRYRRSHYIFVSLLHLNLFSLYNFLDI